MISILATTYVVTHYDPYPAFVAGVIVGIVLASACAFGLMLIIKD